MSATDVPTLGNEGFNTLISEINSIFVNLLNIASPASDVNFWYWPENSGIIWGRDGNDTLLGFNPGNNNSEQSQIDYFIGELTDKELAGEGSSRNGNNRFILGDWKQPYYANGNPCIFGLNNLAIISDFNPTRDIIQLHGTPQDYQLIDFGIGKALVLQQQTGPDVIGFLLGTSNLSLESKYFQYEGNTPPKGPVLAQAKQIGTVGIDYSTSSATDSLGNVYVTGATSGSLGESNTGSSDAFLAKYDSQGNQQWIKQFGTPDPDFGYSIATDKEGNSYLTGLTKADAGTTNQGFDSWVAKYDSNGNQIWLQNFGTGSVLNSCDIDDQGNVYVSGFQIGEAPGFLTYRDDPWVAKYDTNGNQQWYQEFGSPNVSDQLFGSLTFDESYGVTVSNDGSVYTTGWTLDDLAGENAGFYDVWIAKHDNNGQQQWIKQFGTPDYDWAWGADTDSQGNLYITGWTLGDLGGKNAGSYDAWIAKYDEQGNQQWIRQFGTPGDDEASRINIDSNDNIFVTGFTDNSLGGPNAGSYDAWAVKYDTSGNQAWATQFGTPKLDQGLGISSDNAGNLYVTGITEGSLGASNAGSEDGWVAKLDAENGTLKDFTGTPNSVSDRDTLIGSDSAGILSGNFNNDILDEGINVSTHSVGGEDVDFSDSAPFSITDTLTSLIAGFTQAVAGAAEGPIVDDLLKDSLLTLGLDFSNQSFMSPNPLL